MLETPVLFLIFNRPDTTKRVFDAIRLAKPRYLYVAADGPREEQEGEVERCAEVRQIVAQVDWECEVHTLFHETNLGCGIAPAQAITWFFEKVEEGIILEDDCLPDLSFFSFCEELLCQYRYDERIMHISGDNFQFGRKRGQASYYFSIYSHIWGWATWRRAWQKYDFEIKELPQFLQTNQISKVLYRRKEQNYWLKNFDLVADGKRKDVWDYQWTFTCWKNEGLAILPNTNLVSNIGFGENATHTKGDSIAANIAVQPLKSLQHPNKIVVDKKADAFTFDTHFCSSVPIYQVIRNSISDSIPKSVKARIKKIVYDHKFKTFN